MRWPNTKQEECKSQHESEDTVPSKTPLAANARGVVTLDEDLKPATTRLPRPYLTPWRQFAVQLQPISGHSIGDTVCHSVEENRVFKAFVCAEPKVDMSFESLKSQLVWIAKGLGEKNTYKWDNCCPCSSHRRSSDVTAKEVYPGGCRRSRPCRTLFINRKELRIDPANETT